MFSARRRSRPTTTWKEICNFFLFIGWLFDLKESPGGIYLPVHAKIFLGAGLLALIVPSAIANSFPDSGPVIHGKKARIYSAGQAAAPKKAPPEVKLAILAGNQLCSKTYCYGGGHRSLMTWATIARARSPMC
jgi:hypothetical protein